MDLSDPHFPFIGILGQGQHEELERGVRVDGRCRNLVENRLQERGDLRPWLLEIEGRHPLDGGGIDDRKVQLFVGGSQMHEEIEGAIDDVIDDRIGAIDFVDDDDGFMSEGQRFAQDERGLRHGAFFGIDEDQHAIHHAECPLHFAAEICVARRVDDVNLHTFIGHAGVFCADRDATLALLIH